MRQRTYARIGAVACAGLVVVVVVPVAVLSGSELDVYYGAGPVGPPLLAVFAAVVAVALLGGAAGRSDPATAAGVSVAVGAILAVLAIWWALAAGEVVGGLATSATFDYHRWVVTVAALLVPLASGAYARAVLDS